MLRASSNLLRKLTILLIICCFSLAWADAKYGGGTGEPNDPYQIWDANDMQAIGADANDWDKCFILMADIDLGEYEGEEFNIIGADSHHPFVGIFDGNDHTISNFSYNSTERDSAGLFGCVHGEGAEIKNVRLIDPNVDAGTGSGVGSLVGRLFNATMTNCCAQDGAISGYLYVGGLVGHKTGTATSCYSTGSAAGRSRIGGLFGYNSGPVSDCYSTGSATGDDSVGGLIGSNSGTIIRCHSAVSAVGESSVGGLMGNNNGTTSSCYSTGSATGKLWIGGLLGCNVGPLSDCYSTGSATGESFVGGLVGYHVVGRSPQGCGTITDCYSTGEIVGTEYTGGLIGGSQCPVSNSYWGIETSNEPNMCSNDHEDCNNSYGKTTAEMHQQSTFTDWDFINVWNIGENQTYPYLRTVHAGDINKDKTVNFLDVCIMAEQWCNEQ